MRCGRHQPESEVVILAQTSREFLAGESILSPWSQWTDSPGGRQTRTLQIREEIWITHNLRGWHNLATQAHHRHRLLVQKQTDIFRAQSQLCELRQRGIDLDEHSPAIDDEKRTLLHAIAVRQQEFEQFFVHAVSDSRRHVEDSNQHRAKVSGRELPVAEGTIRDILSEAQARETSELETLRAIATLDSARRRLCEKLDASQEQLSAAKTVISRVRRDHNLIRNGSMLLEAKRLHVIRNLVFTVVVLLGFSRYLGSRLAPALRWKAFLLSRWRDLAIQKVEARRQLRGSLHVNADLRARLGLEQSRTARAERLALGWQSQFQKSSKARDDTARKFKKSQREAATRFTSTTTQLLAGLLFLWRLNLIMSQQLADTRSILRALEEAPLEVGPESAKVEESPTPVLDSPAPSQLSGPSDTCTFSDVGHDAPSTAPRGVTADEADSQTSDPASASPTALQDRFVSCAVDTADLLASSVEAGTMTEPSAEDVHLRERVRRLQEKVAAMEAIDTVYRGLLICKTKPNSSSSDAGSEHTASGDASSPNWIPRARRPTMLGGQKPPGKGKPARIFSQPLAQYPFPIVSTSRESSAEPLTHSWTQDPTTSVRQPLLLTSALTPFS